MKVACLLSVQVEQLGDEALLNLAKTTLASKILGADSEFFSQLCVEAVTRVAAGNKGGKVCCGVVCACVC